jgi:uncharacterized protein YecE (DUF72 family)
VAAQHYIGTSGWSYEHWEGPFYPEGLSSAERLSHYAGQLASAEIDNSFYKLPSEQTLTDWREAVPEGFVFAAKASRYITHMKKLKDPDDNVPRLIERLDVLGSKLGPILFQLPPSWHRNTERLERFLARLDDRHRWAFEFRDQSWIGPSTLDLLARYNAAFCVYELDGFEAPHEVTADFVYVRLHGPAGPYHGSYDENALDLWAQRIGAWLQRGLDVHCYFDNDEAGHAAQNALALTRRLDGRGSADDRR